MNTFAPFLIVIPGAESRQRCGGKGTHLMKTMPRLGQLGPLPSARFTVLAGDDIREFGR